jgi:hypothetical protein
VGGDRTALLVEKREEEEESWSPIPTSTAGTRPRRSGNTPPPLWLEVTFESRAVASRGRPFGPRNSEWKPNRGKSRADTGHRCRPLFFLPESGKLAVQAHLQITVADSLRTGPFNVRAQRRVHRAASLSFPRARPTKIAKLPRGKLPRPSVPRDPRAVPPLQDPKDRRPGLAVSSPSATLSCHHELGGGPGGVEHGKYLVHPPCHAIMSSE